MDKQFRKFSVAQYRKAAQLKWNNGKEIRVQANAAVSTVKIEGAAYVQAWVRISDDEAEALLATPDAAKV
jgi:hypothetical protein